MTDQDFWLKRLAPFKGKINPISKGMAHYKGQLKKGVIQDKDGHYYFTKTIVDMENEATK